MVELVNVEDCDVVEISPIAEDEPHNDTATEDEDDDAQLQLAERGEFSDDDDVGRVIEEIKYSTPDGKSHRLNKESGPTPQPQVGMIFEDWEAVERYFRSYAKQQGFGIVRAHGSYRQRNGKPTKERRAMTWNCERFGNKDTRRRVNGRKIKLHSLSKNGVKFATRKSKKCQCPVSLYAGSKLDGHWDIRRVVLEHFGHTPAPSKAKYVAMFWHDDITRVVRKRLWFQMEAGCSVPQIHRSLAKERNGLENTTFTERDLRNVIARKKKLKMDAEGGDANALVNYLKKMHQDNENFFHMERVDEIDRLKDVMWVDARSRAAYVEFSDVVCFDTTYLTNKFKLKFGNFVGVNHHGQTTLFGCALLSHENSETFEWLFSTWLECMGGRAPGGFLTDQDAAMRKALKCVMPQSRHRWCLWHILQKFARKLGMYEKYEEFKVHLHNVIYDSLTAEAFEEAWCSAMDKYQLHQNDWLTGLYEERHMWVPAYMKHIFWAEMKTTQRSESINSFFDGYVSKQTMLHEFASQYFSAIEARVNAEELADEDCERNLLEPITEFKIELEFRAVYTSAKFYEFQLECMKIMYVHVPTHRMISETHMELTVEDRVYYKDKNLRKDIVTEKTCEYKVILVTKTTEACCTCKLLECHGIMCRHLIKVFDVQKIRKLPPVFILDRWRKDIQRPYTKVKVKFHDPEKTEEVLRIDKMQLVFDEVSLLAAENEDDTEDLIRVLTRHIIQLEERRAKESQSKVGDNGQISVYDPNLVRDDDETMNKKDYNKTDDTPPSVGNKKRVEIEHTPPSVKKALISPPYATTPGAAESVAIAGESRSYGVVGENVCEVVPIGVAPVASVQVTPSAGATIHSLTPSIVKDPPLPKNPRHRTTDSRYKSAVELNTTTKGKAKTKGPTTKAKKGQAKVLEECTLKLQQQQEAFELFLEKQASIQQAQFQQQVRHVQQQASFQHAAMHHHAQQQMSSYGWMGLQQSGVNGIAANGIAPIDNRTSHGANLVSPSTSRNLVGQGANVDLQATHTNVGGNVPNVYMRDPTSNLPVHYANATIQPSILPLPHHVASVGAIAMPQSNHIPNNPTIGYLTRTISQPAPDWFTPDLQLRLHDPHL